MRDNMNIKEDLLNQEIEHWKNFYNNYDSLADSMLVTALAFYKEDEREEKFKSAIELLKSLKEPLNGAQMFDSIKADIDSYERINNEAKIAIRTLTWVKEIEDKDVEGEPEENISSKDIDKEKDSDV